ncbi:dihydropteroate synthase [Luteolibacter pohnpeiensis]|uniref:Dihydropteroate synthase n=1 Tax=Luteolibacter pohnpeiensis TaxID=454153 RepID=A0A934VWP3_9BACT|nr:dihydropteroate synthase [Luteolibacter pohnpeiensis]MBK1883490.1 dihydropteroate synthase [Luteolibacter pohnpeiensis]
MHWKIRGNKVDLSQIGMIMGILNVTPDSFSDGGSHADVPTALAHAHRMIEDGADIIDIGGESTRPGAAAIPVDIEIQRTLPIIRALRSEWDGLISIDTHKSAVAAAALEAGADIVNDISGLEGDPEMTAVCNAAGCGVVVMHMQGDPRTMQLAPAYEDVTAEVKTYFTRRLETLERAGMDLASICLDPGIGFGKSAAHNLELIRNLDKISPAASPVLLGVSRKSFIASTLGNTDLSLRDWPTVALTSYARERGVMIHRVHQVKRNAQALRMTEAIMGLSRKN